jgi:SAM-dependent methyltransferase
VSQRLYGALAGWWPLLSPPEDRADDAAALQALIPGARSLLEPGCGSGALVSHLPQDWDVVLVDRSPEMLTLSRANNPGRVHIEANLRTMSLGLTFDAVLLHDVVMYLAEDGALDDALRVAAAHLKPGGRLVIVPDVLEDSFEETVVTGTGSHEDGRACVLTEWHHDPTPGDGQSEVELSLLYRRPGETVQAVHERHTLLLISAERLWERIQAAGLRPVSVDPMAAIALGRPFVAEKPAEANA